MTKISKKAIVNFVEKNIQKFHDKRLDSIKTLQLGTILEKKNPYLFKAKNILLAEEFIKTIADAFLSSQEEAIFGGFLEELAIFICEKAYGGTKSSAEGIDLEFSKGGAHYLAAIKSGPNWGNSQQIRRMEQNFKQAKRIFRTSASKSQNIIAVNGCCYGKEPHPDKGDYFKYCGQDFWELISGDKNFYTEIIEPLGHKAKEKNELFGNAYAAMVNKFTKQFMDAFCLEGRIDWERIVRFNSGKNKHGKMLKDIRKAKNLSLVELAQKLKISQSDLSKIERDETTPTRKQNKAIKVFIFGI